jgi:hypothetical protein
MTEDLARRAGLSGLIAAALLCSGCGSAATSSPSGAPSVSAGAQFTALRQGCKDELTSEQQQLVAAGGTDAAFRVFGAAASTTYRRCASQLAALGLPQDIAQPLFSTWDKLAAAEGQIAAGIPGAQMSSQFEPLEIDEQVAIAGVERYLNLPSSTPRSLG